MKQFLYITLGFLFLSACEKTVQLDLDQSPEFIIIEGLVTDQMAKHYVKVSKSVQFSDTGQTPRVSGANVEVSDDKGNIWTYVEFAPGYYEAPEPFAGEVGTSYTMSVAFEGHNFTASETLLSNGTIDSLGVRVDEEERAATNGNGYFHEVLLYLTEPQATQDYYLFKFYRDGEVLDDDGETVFFTDDIAVRENVDGFAIPFYYTIGQHARAEIYSTTRQAFLHFRDLEENLNNDGGMFSGQPANVSTNIVGGALGYFQVSSVRSAEIEVTE